MPHKGKGVYCRYDHVAIGLALNAVRSGSMSANMAAKTYGVPRSTIGDRLRGKVEDDAHPGNDPVIPLETENEIVSIVLSSATRGFGITKQELIHRVGVFCSTRNLKTPFTDGKPGKDWWAGFLKRHPEVKLRKPEPLTTVRSRMMNGVIVGQYLLDLQSLMSKLGLTNKPNLVWNADETGIPLTHQPDRVLARSGTKFVPGRVSNSRENMTMMATVNASGYSMPPLFIIKGKTKRCLTSLETAKAPPGSLFTHQKNAWMEDVLSTNWFKDIFLRCCGPERPQLLIWDSHHSHETLEILELARDNKIEVFAFPPHTTHYLCPLDRCVFGPFKKAYNKVCSTHMSKDASATVDKASLCGLVTEAYQSSFCRTNIVSGFEATSILPWNPLRIPARAFAPSVPYDKLQSVPETEHPLHWVGKSTPFDVPPVTGDTVPVESLAKPAESIPPTLSEAADVPSDNVVPVVPLEIVYEDGATETVFVPVEHENPDMPTCSSWQSDIQNIFGTPQCATETSAAPSTRITSHRLLTSDTIISMKKENAEKKLKADAEKENRKRKREEQKELKSPQGGEGKGIGKGISKGKGIGKKSKKVDSNTCFICFVVWKTAGDKYPWIACDKCNREMHQRCIPAFHQEVMRGAIDNNVDFTCHVCLASK